MVYEPACIASITSFLQEATPYYTPIGSLTSNEEISSQYKEILTLVITVLYRILTEKESEVSNDQIKTSNILIFN